MTRFVGWATPKKGCPTLKEGCPTPRFHIQLGRARIWPLGPRDAITAVRQRIDLFYNCTTPAASQSGFRIYFGSKNKHGNGCRRHTALREGGLGLAGRRGHVLVRQNSKHPQIRHAACYPYARCSLDAFMRATTIADETFRRVLDTQRRLSYTQKRVSYSRVSRSAKNGMCAESWAT
jgi:hypothetical protein